MKIALITGITGQDGSYLAELLIEKGYGVHGIMRRASTFNTERIEHLRPDLNSPSIPLKLHYGDLSDSSSLNRILEKIQPDEIYNLGAQSHVQISFEIPEYTGDINAIGTLRLLDAIRETGIKTRFYQASTSEIFGNSIDGIQSETTPFRPCSPYAIAKLYGYWIAVNYRESYCLHASNGILFNHESPRRGLNFVTKKITSGVARIKKGLQDRLYLGNLDSCRDWGYAKDFVNAMWLMLQQETPDDYVIATNETYSVREFCKRTFGYVGIDVIWKGIGLDEKGIDNDTGNVLIEVDKRYFRPVDVGYLRGNANKAKEKLGWIPSIGFDELIKIMMDYELEQIKRN